jgi:hypothetical protein
VKAGLGPGIQDGSSSLVDSDVAAVDHVEGPGCPESEDGDAFLSSLLPARAKACSNFAITVLQDTNIPRVNQAIVLMNKNS